MKYFLLNNFQTTVFDAMNIILEASHLKVVAIHSHTQLHHLN